MCRRTYRKDEVVVEQGKELSFLSLWNVCAMPDGNARAQAEGAQEDLAAAGLMPARPRAKALGGAGSGLTRRFARHDARPYTKGWDCFVNVNSRATMALFTLF
jgi:hypothetical protein